jgi:hypothetical protein
MSIILQGSTSGSVTLQEPAIAGTTVLDLPATSGNVVVDSATQTLTNKTLTSPTIGGTPTGVGVLTSGTSVASTSGTSIDFTSIPSWVKRVTVMFQGVSTSGTSTIQVQIGDSGGIENTGYVATSVRVATNSTTAGGSLTSGFPINVTPSAADIVSGTLVCNLMGSNLWVASLAGKASTTLGLVGGGDKTLSATLDRVRITTVNGTDTFDAGSINILYE